MYEKKFEKRLKKKGFLLGKKNFGSDTETRPWFWFLIPKPGFGRTLLFSSAVSLAELQVLIPKIS